MRRAAQRFINYITSERGMTPANVHAYRQDMPRLRSQRVGYRVLGADLVPSLFDHAVGVDQERGA